MIYLYIYIYIDNEIVGKFDNNDYMAIYKLNELNLSFNNMSTQNIIRLIKFYSHCNSLILKIYGNPYDQIQINHLDIDSLNLIRRNCIYIIFIIIFFINVTVIDFSILYNYDINSLIQNSDKFFLPNILPKKEGNLMNLCSDILDCYIYNSDINYLVLLLNILLIDPNIHDLISDSISKCDSSFYILLLDHVEDYGYLCLDGLKVNDDDVNDLCEIMEGLKYLKRIDLSNNSITILGLNAIMKSMYKFDMLKELTFKGNEVDGSKILERMNDIYSKCVFIY